jgi:cobalt-zinc-cadmium resistance protein CzcA
MAIAAAWLHRQLPPHLTLVTEDSPQFGTVLKVEKRSGEIIKLIGPQLPMLIQAAVRFRGDVAQIPGVFDVELLGAKQDEQVDYDINHRKVSFVRLETRTVIETVAALKGGQPVGGPPAGMKPNTVAESFVVIYDEQSRRDALRVRMFSPTGKEIELGQVAEEKSALVPRQIYRENGNPVVYVLWQVKKEDSATARAKIDAIAAAIQKSAPRVRIVAGP